MTRSTRGASQPPRTKSAAALEIESFAALSKDQVADIVRTGASATDDDSVNWEFTQIAECCCSFTCGPMCGRDE